MVATGGKPQRIEALDFTKGALVLTMVLYHWINYFGGSQDNRYLRFLTPSFIFITGFLISNVHISRYGISDLQLPKRLIQRGLKILGVFLLLNVTRTLVFLGSSQELASSFHVSARNLVDIFLIGRDAGNGPSKSAAFFILVPIGYLLILSALLLVGSRFYRFAFHVACLVSLLGVLILNSLGLESPMLELLAIGLLGVMAGYIPIENVNAVVRHPYLLAASYLLYLAAISVWNIVYPLQIIGVCLSLMIIYEIAQQSGTPRTLRACAVLLGRYSLVGYIVQIAILQSLRVGLDRIRSEAVVLGLSFVLAFALTIISVVLLDKTRAQSTTLDKLYKAVFA